MLEELPINMIDDFIIDPLHCIDHGVMKLLLKLWMKGSTLYDIKFTKQDIKELDRKIFEANKDMPSDIHRSVRPFTYMSYWKGTEFRAFLLYVGVVVLKDHLPIETYEHFLQFFCAVRICQCEKYSKFVDLADTLFRKFVKNFILLFGGDHVVSNVHSLIHIVDDVKRFGNFNKISAYKFENALGLLKRRVQARGGAIEQIARRLIEVSKLALKPTVVNLDPPRFLPTMKYPFKPHTTSETTGFKRIQITPSSFLSIKKIGDSFFLTRDKKIVQMNYATRMGNGDAVICGQAFLKKESFFQDPFKSDFIDIYLADNTKGKRFYISTRNIECKLLKLDYKDKFFFAPILHTLDEL